MCLRSERQPVRGENPHSHALRDWLHCSQTEEVSERVWYSEELDAGLPLGGCVCIARQTFCPGEPIMSTRGPRQENWRLLLRRQGGVGKHYFNSLVTEQMHAGAPIHPPAPIVPEQRGRANNKRMQKDTDLTRLFGGAPIPLALLTPFTGTTPANAGGIHQPQAPISLLPPLQERERVACWAAQRSIRLERKILPREVTRFPGRGCGRWAISRCRN